MTIGPPPRTQAQLGDAKADKAASDLEAVVKTYLRGKHIIVAERYFRVDGGTPWSQVSKSVAAERNKLHPLKPGSTTGSRPPWHRMGLDLIDYYPGNPPFAVAMEQGTGGRKSKLVGYFELAAVKK